MFAERIFLIKFIKIWSHLTVGMSQSQLDRLYSEHIVDRYQWIFGQEFLSTGGFDSTAEIVATLDLKRGEKVLDVGSGCGGHDFYMAERFGVTIDAVDLCNNMMRVALQHLEKRPQLKPLINFRICDVTKEALPEATYDVIYSRDVLLHIDDKRSLLGKFHDWLKPGGRLFFTDYCLGTNGPIPAEFQREIAERDYRLVTVDEYRRMTAEAGFVNVDAADRGDKFLETLNREMQKLSQNANEFLRHFDTSDLRALSTGWDAKVRRCNNGHETWIWCRARKPQ